MKTTNGSLLILVLGSIFVGLALSEGLDLTPAYTGLLVGGIYWLGIFSAYK